MDIKALEEELEKTKREVIETKKHLLFVIEFTLSIGLYIIISISVALILILYVF
jgi:hypothetical protein